jgi:hypothetical protein
VSDWRFSKKARVADTVAANSRLEQNRNSGAKVKSLQCGLYFHPSDENLSLGTPARKKPLRGRAVGYSYSGSAVEARS